MVAVNHLTPLRHAASEPDTPPLPSPPTPADLSAVWSGAVFAAVAVLQKQLDHPNTKVARAAADSILDLEKTRLRHGRELAGVVVEGGPQAPRAADLVNRECPPAGGQGTAAADAAGSPEPHTASADHPPDHTPDPEAEAALARVEAYLAAVERGDINVPDDLDDDDIDEDELAAIPLPEPPPTLAERFRARYGAPPEPPHT